eukprot:scaffold4756_cov88-Cylindrotheca_fusiformis.AAC.1
MEDELITFPEKVGQIGDYAFYRCGGLQEVIVSSASTKLGIGAFQECDYLRFVQLPEGLQVIEESLFHYCVYLETVKIPSTVIKIGKDAFGGCASLTCFDLPHGLLEIGPLSFFKCKSIRTLHIPSTVSTIGGSAFRHHSNLTDGDSKRQIDTHRNRERWLKRSTTLNLYQSYYSVEEAMGKLGDLLDKDPLAATTQVDAFGMTPLHILSLSQTPNLRMTKSNPIQLNAVVSFECIIRFHRAFAISTCSLEIIVVLSLSSPLVKKDDDDDDEYGNGINCSDVE